MSSVFMQASVVRNEIADVLSTSEVTYITTAPLVRQFASQLEASQACRDIRLPKGPTRDNA